MPRQINLATHYPSFDSCQVFGDRLWLNAHQLTLSGFLTGKGEFVPRTISPGSLMENYHGQVLLLARIFNGGDVGDLSRASLGHGLTSAQLVALAEYQHLLKVFGNIMKTSTCHGFRLNLKDILSYDMMVRLGTKIITGNSALSTERYGAYRFFGDRYAVGMHERGSIVYDLEFLLGTPDKWDDDFYRLAANLANQGVSLTERLGLKLG